jgi:NAD(P)H dehydrogenase (quinone)
MSKPLLVTGASGHLGQRVVELLLEQNAGPVIATTRSPEKLAKLAARGVDVRAADFDDDASLAKAFAGAGRALLISTDALDRPGRLEQHKRAIKALEAAGASHILYTSFLNPGTSVVAVGPDHHATEVAIQQSNLSYTFLRNSLYTETLLGVLPGALKSGSLIDARGGGKAAFVTREDCARAAASALASEEKGSRIFDITGPEALTSVEVAGLLRELFGAQVTHTSVPVPALIEGMLQHGLPRPIAELLASFDVGIAKGELAHVSDAVTTLTGRAPTGVKAFLEANRGALLG